MKLARSLTLVALLSLVTLIVATPASADHWDYDDTINRPDLHQGHADALRLYWAFFDRQPDDDGAQYWITAYDSCDWSSTRIAQFFSVSPEFVATYGEPSDDEFIDLAYGNVLDRSPDAAGRVFWAGRLADGQTRGSMVADMAFSPEFRVAHPLPSDGVDNIGCTPASEPHRDPGSTLLAFTEAWQNNDWTTMATFSTDSVVEFAQDARDGIDTVALDPSEIAGVLDTCGHPGSGEWDCELLATPPSGSPSLFGIVVLGTEDGFSIIFLTGRP